MRKKSGELATVGGSASAPVQVNTGAHVQLMTGAQARTWGKKGEPDALHRERRDADLGVALESTEAQPGCDERPQLLQRYRPMDEAQLAPGLKHPRGLHTGLSRIIAHGLTLTH